MSWEIRYLPEVLENFRTLDGSQRILVRKAIEKVRKNPLPETEGGYGKWLGNKGASKLSGFLKIKLRGAGLRIVYQLVRNANHMVLVVIGVREDDAVYEIAHHRIAKHDLQGKQCFSPCVISVLSPIGKNDLPRPLIPIPEAAERLVLKKANAALRRLLA